MSGTGKRELGWSGNVIVLWVLLDRKRFLPLALLHAVRVQQLHVQPSSTEHIDAVLYGAAMGESLITIVWNVLFSVLKRPFKSLHGPTPTKSSTPLYTFSRLALK